MLRLLALLLLLAPTRGFTQSFDHTHAVWNALLGKHVKETLDGSSSRVDYKGFSADRERLRSYLKTLSAVTPADYGRWSKPKRFAFLANAYNAFTVEKVLTRFPDLESIRDFGTLIGNPWKDRFFSLLGKRQHLDGIEHEMLRAKGLFDDPRVHVALNCASIGCPMLARQALTAERLDAQLEDLMRRFLGDRTRNRFNPRSGNLELSRVFDWYAEDFKTRKTSFLGYAGFSSVAEVGARYPDLLAERETDRAALRAMRVAVRYLPYDWGLNQIGR